MRRIEDYYLSTTDISPQVRQQMARRMLLALPGFSRDLAEVTIAQWNEVAHKKGIPVAQSDRYAGRSIPCRKSVSPQSKRSAQQALESLQHVPFGQMLGEAGLLNAEQIDALVSLHLDDPSCKFGDLAVREGYIKQETVDFMSVRLPQLLKASWHYPLGQYLRLAALLDDEQVSLILMEQAASPQPALFGELAIAKGWVSRRTVNWTIEHTQF
ncbi:MAG: hypothetical protein AAFX40_02275 [Cyanobacteria bacterium J06639_1]